MIVNSKKVVLYIGVCLLSLGSTVAKAEDFCLTGFGGLTYWLNFQQFGPFSGSSSGPITGRVTGGATCGTLGGGIPLDGSSNFDGNNLNIGFQVHAVDNLGCGSVEFKVIINLTTLSGPLDLWNTKNDFANSGTVTLGACPPSVNTTSEVLPLGATDAAGNTQQ